MDVISQNRIRGTADDIEAASFRNQIVNNIRIYVPWIQLVVDLKLGLVFLWEYTQESIQLISWVTTEFVGTQQEAAEKICASSIMQRM